MHAYYNSHALYVIKIKHKINNGVKTVLSMWPNIVCVCVRAHWCRRKYWFVFMSRETPN